MAEYTFICATCLFLVYAILYILARVLKSSSKYMKNLPGPPPVFPFGNTLDFIQGPTVFLDNLLRYLKTYGDTVLVHDGCFSWAFISIDYDFIEMMYNSTNHIEKSKQYDFFDGWLGQGLLTNTGSKWKSHRKIITPSFHFSILQEFIQVFDRVGDNLVRKLKNEVGKDSVDISKVVSLYALDVICEASMGVEINALDQDNSEYIRSIKEMCTIIVERSFSFLYPVFYPLTWNYYREKRALKVIHEHVEGVIESRIEEHKKKKNMTDALVDEFGVKKRMAFLDMLLQSRIDGRPLTREELRDEVNTFMFEGHDTTSSAISFCIFMIATNPDVQKKIFKEQMDIFGSDIRTARPTYKELNEMKYLDLVIKETLRLFPSVPFFGRKLAHDVEFKGTLLPKGLNVMIFPYALQRDSRYYSDPEKFIPERFEDSSCKLPFVYTPFSAGARNCIGQKFAMLEMLSTVSKIVRNFELMPARPEHKLKLAAETILISKNGIKISLKDRFSD